MATAPSALAQRFAAPGPKRLLALDGGGIRGLVTIGYLEGIERLLRQRHGNERLVLADYFDFIGGTSTGSVIAGLLALGQSVAEIRELYLKLGREAFRPKRSWLGPVSRLMGAKFDDRPLVALLERVFGDRRLGSADLLTGLMIVAKRVDTASTWVLVNTPGNRYYEFNRDLRLWEVIRASTAAPTYFQPQHIADVGGGESGLFVDGGVSMHCNPAFQLLMAATLDGFGARWPLGDDRLLLCSVGTGNYPVAVSQAAAAGYTNLHWLGLLAVQMMRDASELNQTMLQWMSASPTAVSIDTQIGALEHDLLTPRPMLTYLRYEVDLEAPALAAIGLDYDDKAAANLREMSRVESIADLDRVGRAAATAQVRGEHFPPAFDRQAGSW